MSTATPILVFILVSSIAMDPAMRDDDPPPLDRETAAARLVKARTIAGTEPGRAAELLEAVSNRAPEARTRFLARFNLGVLELREGRYDAAREAFKAAARMAPDTTTRRDALYNLAHAHTADTPTPESEPDELERIEKRLKGLRHAEDKFLAAARIDPGHMPAARNLERVRRMIRELESRRERLEQQQQSPGENTEGEQEDGEGDQSQPTDAAERLQRLADQQREQAQRNAQSQPSSQRERDQRADEQQQLSDQTQELAEKMGEQRRERMEQAQEAQQRAQEALESGDSEAAAQHQRQAADAIERAAQDARRQPSDGQGQQQRTADAQPEEIGESIDPLARDLLEREERQRRSRRQYRPGGRPIEVEEDW